MKPGPSTHLHRGWHHQHATCIAMPAPCAATSISSRGTSVESGAYSFPLIDCRECRISYGVRFALHDELKQGQPLTEDVNYSTKGFARLHVI